MSANFNYSVDDKILNYTGRIAQNLYAQKTINGNGTTYSILPIEAKSRVGLWLQEHSRFFNFIITWFLSKRIQKDPNCLILKKDRVNPEPRHNNVLEKIIYRITNSTSRFFQDNDKDNVYKSIYSGIIDSNSADGKKVQWIMNSLTQNGKVRSKRIDILFDVMTQKNYFNQNLFDQIMSYYDDLSPKTQENAVIYAVSHLGQLGDTADIIQKALNLDNIPDSVKISCLPLCLFNPGQFDSKDVLKAALFVLKNQDNKDIDYLVEEAKKRVSEEINSNSSNRSLFGDVLDLAEAVFTDPTLFSDNEKKEIARLLDLRLPVNMGTTKLSDNLEEQLLEFIKTKNNYDRLKHHLIRNSIQPDEQGSRASNIISLLGDSYDFDIFGAQLTDVTKYMLENQDEFDQVILEKLVAYILKNNKHFAAKEFDLSKVSTYPYNEDDYPFLKDADVLALADMALKHSYQKEYGIQLLFNNYAHCSQDQKNTVLKTYFKSNDSDLKKYSNHFKMNLKEIVKEMMYFPDDLQLQIYDYIFAHSKELDKQVVKTACEAAINRIDEIKNEDTICSLCNCVFSNSYDLDLSRQNMSKIFEAVLAVDMKGLSESVAINAVAIYVINNNKYTLEQKASHYSKLIEGFYEDDLEIMDNVISELELKALALINSGPHTLSQFANIIVPLAELLRDLCGDETSKAANDFLLDKRFWNNKGNFTVNTIKDQYDISIPMDLIADNPEKILELFHAECLSKRPGINCLNIIALNQQLKTEKEEHQAVDQGGPSRQFISTLFENLVKKSKKIQFEKGKTGFYVPTTSNSELTKDEKILFKAIGKLMGMCLTSRKPLSIGQIFDPKVFEIIKAMYSSAVQGKFDNLSNATLVNIYQIMIGKQDECLKHYNTLLGLYPSNDDIRNAYNFCNNVNFTVWPDTLPENPTDYDLREHLDDICNDLKDSILEQAKAYPCLQPIFKICQGIALHYNNLGHNHSFEIPRNMDHDVMELNIQGRFSKELVKDSLKFPPDEYSPIAAKYQRLKGFFDDWIDESDDEMVRDFLIYFTGSKTIGIEGEISVDVADISNSVIDAFGNYVVAAPQANTCSRQITIPNYTSYRQLKEQLDSIINEMRKKGVNFNKK
jgi:hypothetical protein